MIESLFGDLAPRRLDEAATPSAGTVGRPAQATLARAAEALADTLSPMVDVVVDTSPAEAMRSHFAARRELQPGAARPMITLLDPSRLWAPQVLHALSDAAACPIERLNLRERATLRTLALIERLSVPRRGLPPLKVLHPDIRVPGAPAEEIAHALAEGSALTAVIVGTLQPHALLSHLRALLAATRAPGWACPWLVFVLPPAAAALGARIEAQAWPAHVRVLAVTEAEGSPAGVWNSVLGAWEATRAYTPPPARGPEAPHDGHAADPLDRHDDIALSQAAAVLPSVSPAALARLLAPLARTDGVRACAIVDLRDGDLLATDCQNAGAVPAPQDRPDLAAVTQGLCAARRAHAALAGLAQAPDEVLVTAGPWQSLLRGLPGQPGLGFVAVLERAHANLALLRFRLLDAVPPAA
ncbi:hypothetical protein AACH10_09690 [Ideonella sp. DXS22W]|uniref:Uncharacterized protein n=1 Tax=Pseudaquabacterium inlustre TaxID=2984192 RepID=A0ABU9CH44_9BURK